MSNPETSTPSQCPECRHVMPSGARCHAPALRDHPFCYFHARQRSLKETNMCRLRSVALPPLEDRGAIQLALHEVLAAFADNKIDRKAASIYLYGIQLGLANLSRDPELAAKDPVQSIFPAAYGDELAPGDAGQDPENPDTSGIRTSLPEIDNSATHEYDQEPPPERKALTPQQQFEVEYLTRHLLRATEHRYKDDPEFNPASDAACGTPSPPDTPPQARPASHPGKARPKK